MTNTIICIGIILVVWRMAKSYYKIDIDHLERMMQYAETDARFWKRVADKHEKKYNELKERIKKQSKFKKF